MPYSNREERLAYSRAYYRKNKEKALAVAKAKYEEDKETILERNKEYIKKNPIKRKEKAARYYQRNKVDYIARTAKRRAAKLNRTPRWLSPSELKEIEQLYADAKQLEEIFSTAFHVDHVIPLQGELVSGLHTPENLQILPAALNLSKGNTYNIG